MSVKMAEDQLLLLINAAVALGGMDAAMAVTQDRHLPVPAGVCAHTAPMRWELPRYSANALPPYATCTQCGAPWRPWGSVDKAPLVDMATPRK